LRWISNSSTYNQSNERGLSDAGSELGQDPRKGQLIDPYDSPELQCCGKCQKMAGTLEGIQDLVSEEGYHIPIGRVSTLQRMKGIRFASTYVTFWKIHGKIMIPSGKRTFYFMSDVGQSFAWEERFLDSSTSRDVVRRACCYPLCGGGVSEQTNVKIAYSNV
jgi:hypothetical protein